MNFIKKMFSNEQGYGTVELLLIIAGLGLLATGIFNALGPKLSGSGSTTATSKVTDGIGTMIDSWTTTPAE